MLTTDKTMKFDIQGIVSDVQKMYAKDTKSKAMVTTGDTVKETYKADDGVPIPDDSPLKYLTSLPCLPYNKIAQLAGNEDTGKSTIIGQTMAAAQKSGHLVILFDSEDKFDAARLRTQFGGNPSEIILIKTNEILQGGEKVRKIIHAVKDKYPNAKILFCWDSVGGSQSRSHAERELDNEKSAQPGQDAKENGSVMKMLVSLFNKYPDSISVLLANQVYAKIGFMQVGDKESGGKKIAYHSSLIIILKRIKKLTKVVKGQKMKYGIITRATVTKNHLTQSELSVDQLDFEITAKGAALTDGVTADEDE
jgi:RecA/RadA recombinase